MRGLHIGLVLLLVFAIGCGRPPQVKHPTLPERNASDAERRAIYNDNALHEEWTLARIDWQRADGKTHNWAELEDLSDVYPTTREIREKAAVRDAFVTSLGIPGIGLLSGTAAHQLAANDQQDFSSGTATALFIAGGSALALALLLQLVWHNPKADFASAYNTGLRKELGLSTAQ